MKGRREFLEFLWKSLRMLPMLATVGWLGSCTTEGEYSYPENNEYYGEEE